MTDEERRIALCDKLHRKGFIAAGEEIMKMQREIERLVTELAEAKRHDIRDWYDALERGIKDPIR